MRQVGAKHGQVSAGLQPMWRRWLLVKNLEVAGRPSASSAPRVPMAALSIWLFPHGFGCYMAGTCLILVLTSAGDLAGICQPSLGMLTPHARGRGSHGGVAQGGNPGDGRTRGPVRVWRWVGGGSEAEAVAVSGELPCSGKLLGASYAVMGGEELPLLP